MSRANRRAAATRPVTDPAPPPARAKERPQQPVRGVPGASDAERSINWRACLAGAAIGEVLLLLLANGGLWLADAAFGSTSRLDGGIVGTASFLAVIAGGFVAARMAGRFGVYQGTIVGILFIVVSVVVQFAQEASVVHSSLSGSSHNLVDLGPMRIDNVVMGDLLALFGGSVGGLLARRR